MLSLWTDDVSPTKEFKFLDSRLIVFFESDVFFPGAGDLTEMDFISHKDAIEHLEDKFLLRAF